MNRRILQGMQSTIPPSTSPSASFAGFLAALTQPDRAKEDRAPAQTQGWSDELLAEDVATLSYERALRTHARYHADEPVADPAPPLPTSSVAAADSSTEVLSAAQSAPLKLLKEASITIRLSREEDAQLRGRAAEAGLTVSAYIRSCTFEAEALRALVKDTLTQFRTSAASPQQGLPNPRRRWSSFFWPGRRSAHDTAPNQA